MPIIYGRTRVSGNLIWYGDFTAIAHTTTQESGGKGGGGVTQSNTTYTYEAAVMMAIAEGPIQEIVSMWKGKERHTDLSALTLSEALGDEGQETWGYMVTKHQTQALAYSGTAYVYSPTYQLSDNAEVVNHTFEVASAFQFDADHGIFDADASVFSVDMLTNPRYGAMFSSSKIGDLSRWASYIRAAGLFISPAMTEQQEAREWLNSWAAVTNSAIYWSEGLLKVEPYGDEVVSGNGYTFTPNTTPVYDLTDDDFLAEPGEDPITVERRTPADAFNQVQVEFINRDNQYNVEVVTASDQRNIEEFGLRPSPVSKQQEIASQSVARRVAQLMLQRNLYIRNTYEFRLGWKYVLLEPTDIVTITDAGLGLDRYPVRIVSTEENERGDITVRAEDFPIGVASSPRYPTQAATGFSHRYNEPSGPVVTPTFFEPPIELTSTGLEVWVAVTGEAGANWGGCRVWVSYDNTNYKAVGRVAGGARYGVASAAASAASSSVAVTLSGLGGKMLSGSTEDAEAPETLCWVGGESWGEYFAHEAATLVGSNSYSLGGLVRGAYRSTPMDIPAGAKFVRVDQAIAKSEPLDLSMIGKTIFFKFTSFNQFGAAEEAIETVPVYQYTITGYMVRIPPDAVANLSFGEATLKWTPNAERDIAGYRFRFHYGSNTDWDTATPLHEGLITSSPHTLVRTPYGQITILAKAVDQIGNESRTASYIVAQAGDPLVSNVWEDWPQAPSFSGTITNGSVVGGELHADSSVKFWSGYEGASFWGQPLSTFWPPNSYAELRYQMYVTPSSDGELLIDHLIDGASYTIEYSRDSQSPFWQQAANPFWGSGAGVFWAQPEGWGTFVGGLSVLANESINLRVTVSPGPQQGKLITFTPKIDVPDVSERISGQLISITGSRLAITKAYRIIKNVQLTVYEDGNGGVSAKIIDHNAALGPMISVIDAAGNPVNGKVDAVIQGM